MSEISSTSPAIAVRDVRKIYPIANRELVILDEISFSLMPGQSMALIGPSGSGKTTLLGLCAGLDLPTSGSVEVLGQSWSQLNDQQQARFRRENIGFVFQNFQLMPSLRAWENVALPLELLGRSSAEQQARELLQRVGLEGREDHYPMQLSGGEQQRVALARAFIHRPPILMADEPTGNLDGETGQTIVDLLFELNSEHQTSLFLVTHDMQLAERCHHMLRLRNGRILDSAQ